MQGLSARRGFTGLQFGIVFLILMVLLGILVYSNGFFQRKLNDQKRVALMKEVVVALEEFKSDKKHYPLIGDPIPGGTLVSSSDSFNSMMAALGQGNYLIAKKFADPKFGQLFGEFNGDDAYEDGLKFAAQSVDCEQHLVSAQTDISGVVSYAYYSDGESYVLCLVGEEGKKKTFVSPKY